MAGADLDLALARYFFWAAVVVQLDGSVLIWHMTDWFSTACCIWGTVKK
jgi:hypothetical protein